MFLSFSFVILKYKCYVSVYFLRFVNIVVVSIQTNVAGKSMFDDFAPAKTALHS